MLKKIQVISTDNSLIAEVDTWRNAVKVAHQHFDFCCFILVKGNSEGDITLIRWYIPEEGGLRVETTLNKT